jgi:archaellum component FlaC
MDTLTILKNIESKLEKIENRLESIENRLETIEEHLGIVKEDCSKMGQHINFVENTYSVLRTPLNYITRMICKKNNDLPQIDIK